MASTPQRSTSPCFDAMAMSPYAPCCDGGSRVGFQYTKRTSCRACRAAKPRCRRLAQVGSALTRGRTWRRLMPHWAHTSDLLRGPCFICLCGTAGRGWQVATHQPCASVSAFEGRLPFGAPAAGWRMAKPSMSSLISLRRAIGTADLWWVLAISLFDKRGIYHDRHATSLTRSSASADSS